MSKMTLQRKLILSFLAIGAIPMAIISGLGIYNARHALTEKAQEQLTIARSAKQDALKRYFAKSRADMHTMEVMVKGLVHNASVHVDSLNQEKALEIREIIENQHDLLEMTLESEAVRHVFLNHSDDFADAAKQLKHVQMSGHFGSLWLVNAEGKVLMAVGTENSNSINLSTPDWQSDPLGQIFTKSISADDVVTVDFSNSKGTGRLSAFMAHPVELEGKKGTVIGELTTSELNRIVSRRTGLGQTGESLVVAYTNGNPILLTELIVSSKDYAGSKAGESINSPLVQSALKHDEGSGLFTDPTGMSMASSHRFVGAEGLKWALLTHMDLDEAVQVKEGDKDQFGIYIEEQNYDDFFIFGKSGYCFYTVTHEADYQTNLLTGKYKDSGLGKLVSQAINTNAYALVDFAPYAPSNNEPAAFIGQPITNSQTGEVELVVALQLSIDAINDIMQERSGMGETGESYLVGPDHLMRSDSCFSKETHTVMASFRNPTTGAAKTEAVDLALKGETGIKETQDYHGEEVLSAYTPIQIDGLNWALISDIDVAEAYHEVAAMTNEFVILASIFLAITFFVALATGKRTANPLKEAISILRSSADQVASASSQVAESSQNLASGANQQASSLEESSAALEELAGMTSQNTDNARQASLASSTAKDSAESGREATSRMVAAMDRIKASSDETAKIVKTIDEIAFQTNLLALNAAVEAARAGDAGRGFAVVAEEVRSLAQRSAVAAKDTSSLIEESIRNAGDGVSTCDEVTSILSTIVEEVEKVSQIIAEVSAASEEQTKGIGQVNTGVAQMNGVTQSNAASSEECASASEELSAQAREMHDVVRNLEVMVGSAQERVLTDANKSKASKKPLERPHEHKPTEAPLKRPATSPTKPGKNGQAKKEDVAKAKHVPSPEAIIPFDEDDDF